MNFNSLVETLDYACLDTFGVCATFTPSATGQSQSITGIIAPPPINEDFLPGGNIGPTLIHFHVRYVDITPNPQKGDLIQIDGVNYDIFLLDIDTSGSARLRLRQRSV